MPEQTVHIDFSAIPDSDIQIGCAVLASSIRLALRDPEKRKAFERWKAEKEKRAADAARRKE